MHPDTLINKLLVIAMVVSLSACGWVDSAGSEAGAGAGATTVNAVAQNTIVTQIEESVVTSLLESTASRSLIVDDNQLASDWTWSLQDDNVNGQCDGINGFESQLAADSLTNACTSTSDCEVRIEALENDAQADVLISVPSLKAPVALSYSLSAITNEGTIADRDQVLCIVSINEAPDAVHDDYRVLIGESRVVDSADVDNLLANDTDDEDVRNSALSVVTELVQAPIYASQFSIASDGSFTYTADDSLLIADGETIIDTFMYEITDGIHFVESSATVSIVSSNNAPQTFGSLPDLTLTRITQNETFDETIDLSAYFTDSDNDELIYAVDTQVLPADVVSELSEDGLLRITTLSSTNDAVTGSWVIDMVVSDGLASIDNSFTLTINNSPSVDNQAPVAQQIPDLIASGRFRYNSSAFFNDPDNDELTFTAQGLPSGAQVSSDGFLTGVSNAANAGVYEVTITATDPFEASASSQFALIMS